MTDFMTTLIVVSSLVFKTCTAGKSAMTYELDRDNFMKNMDRNSLFNSFVFLILFGFLVIFGF